MKDRCVIEKKLTSIFVLLCSVVFLFLFGVSFLRTGFFSADISDEYVYFRRDSLLRNLLWLMAVILCATVITAFVSAAEEKHKIHMTAGAVVAAVIVAAVSIYWVGAAQIGPVADQRYICQYAHEFEQGYYWGLAKGGYVGYYRHQLGLITIMRFVFRLFGDENYMAFQYISACLTAVILLSGYGIVKIISRDNKSAELFYLLLAVGCYPMYGYVTFVYGEIGSTAFIMLAAWLLLNCLKCFRWWKLLPLAVSVGIAVQLRTNTVILLLAFLIVLLVKWLGKPERRLVATAAAVLLGVLGFNLLLSLGYREVIPKDSKAIPAVLGVAIGVNDERLPGWNNDYDVEVYGKYDWEPEAAGREGREFIGAFLKKCISNPGYAVKFYYEKLGSQWNVPMYHVLQMNERVMGEQKWPATVLYSGEAVGTVEGYMNVYQFVVYGAVLLLLQTRRKNWRQIESYILLIGVFGGFLFSALWEAKTRYVVPYLFMMLPYAGIGIADCTEWLRRLFCRREK